jgi:hypothetical protein
VDASKISLLDPKVSVFDSSGNLLGTASASTYQGTATLNLTGLTPGQTYYFQAAGATSDVFGMGAYNLTAQFGGLPPPPTIGPDQFDPNNTAATAHNFGTVSSLSQTGLTLDTPANVDYFSFVAASKGTYTVSVTTTTGSGTISLTVLNAQQTVLASVQSQTGGVTLPVSLASGQRYYVKVSSPTGSLLAYTLNLAQSSGGGGSAGGSGGKKLVLLGPWARGDFFYQNAADDPENARTAPPSAVSRLPQPPNGTAATTTETSVGDAELAAPGAFPNSPGGQRSLADALLNFGLQATSVQSATAPVPAVVPLGLATGSARIAVPSLQPVPREESGGGNELIPSEEALAAKQAGSADPPVRRRESGDGKESVPSEEPQGAEPTDSPNPPVWSSSTPVEPKTLVPMAVGLREQAVDACFADVSGLAGLVELDETAPGVAVEDYGPAPKSAAAAVALAVLLGGSLGARRAEIKSRTRWRFWM